MLSVLEKLTHVSIAIIDIHTGFTIGNVHAICIEVHNFSVLVHGEPLQVADESTLVRSSAYN